MPADIIKEWKRGGYLKCFYCKKKHATVGCFESNCRFVYFFSYRFTELPIPGGGLGGPHWGLLNLKFTKSHTLDLDIQWGHI